MCRMSSSVMATHKSAPTRLTQRWREVKQSLHNMSTHYSSGSASWNWTKRRRDGDAQTHCPTFPKTYGDTLFSTAFPFFFRSSWVRSVHAAQTVLGVQKQETTLPAASMECMKPLGLGHMEGIISLFILFYFIFFLIDYFIIQACFFQFYFILKY